MNSWMTEHLRLEAVSSAHADELHIVLSDPEVWPWYAERCPSRAEVASLAASMEESWRLHGVHKWLAYERTTGELVGRGGLSRTPVDNDWAQVYRFLPPGAWSSAAYAVTQPYLAHANWLELGWALRSRHWGKGYAAEIGCAGVEFAFNQLDVRAVVSCTVRHNARSRAVMQRIGMQYAGEVCSRGLVEGSSREQDDAPFATCVLLRDDPSLPGGYLRP